MPDVSVIVPTYNRKDSVRRTLAALERQTLDSERFEVIVVSDGSTDGTFEAVQALKTGLSLRVIQQSNSGPSVARNRGAAEATAALLVFVDDDIEPSPEFLQVHLEAHDSETGLVLIGPQTGPLGEPMPNWMAWEHLMLEKQYANFRSGVWKAGPNNLYSGNMSLRRDHFMASGGFEEKFTRQEDVELGFRLEKLGLTFRFEPRADAIHRSSRSFASWYKTPFEYGRRDVQMARDMGEGRMASMARENFRSRSRLTRGLAYLAIGRPVVEKLLFGTTAALARNSARRVALPFCSVLFNLRYLQGMCSELGGRRALWDLLNSSDRS